VKNIIYEFLKFKKISFEEFFTSYNLFFVKYNEIKNMYEVETALNEIIKKNNTFFIYIFYKFPDYVSTYTKLCILEIYDRETIVFTKTYVKELTADFSFNYQLNDFFKVKKKLFSNKIKINIDEEEIFNFLKDIFRTTISNINRNGLELSIENKELEYCTNTNIPSGLYNIVYKEIKDIAKKIDDIHISTYCNLNSTPFYKELNYINKFDSEKIDVVN
jgi:hypothetical protein